MPNTENDNQPETKKERFGQIREAMLDRQHELSNMEFRIYMHYCYLRFADSGLVKKTMTELAELYRIDYSAWTRYHAALRRKEWLVDGAYGIRPLVGFYNEKETEAFLIGYEKQKKRARRTSPATSFSNPSAPLFDQPADESPADETDPDETEAAKLQKRQFKTDETSVNWTALLMFLQLHIRNTKPFSEPPKTQESVDTLSSSPKGEGELKNRGLKVSSEKTRKPRHVHENLKKRIRKPDPEFTELCKICYFKATPAERSTLTADERGRLNQTLKKLRDAKFDLSKIPKFDEWWKVNWRSGWRENSGRYEPSFEPPRPDQVVSLWNVAVGALSSVPADKSAAPAAAWSSVGRSDYRGDGVEPLDERSFADTLERLLDFADSPADLESFEKWYTASDWQQLIIEIRRIGGSEK